MAELFHLYGLTKSLTFLDANELTRGSAIKCQCGWNGKLEATADLHVNNYKGDRISTHYLCPKSPHILAEILHNPPIKFADQRDVADRRLEK